jgi:hypothetical protein
MRRAEQEAGGVRRLFGRRRWSVALCGLLTILTGAPRARAAAGADVVDDAFVETPGRCHVEGWVTLFEAGAGLANVSPACTRKAWPRLEIGASVQYAWADGDLSTAGPALKLNLLQSEAGAGVALSGAAGWNLRDGDLETASLIVPLSVAAGKRVRFNLNAGWLYVRANAQRNVAAAGVQVETDVGRNVSLMGEVFGRQHGRLGGQTRLRWTPGGGRFDFDLVAGSIGGVGEVSLAATVRP